MQYGDFMLDSYWFRGLIVMLWYVFHVDTANINRLKLIKIEVKSDKTIVFKLFLKLSIVFNSKNNR